MTPSRPAWILIVDDDPDVREVVADALGTFPEMKVQTTSSGMEALACARAQGFDVIITDAQMPAMTGIDLLGHLRGEFPKIPVVMMSGDAISRQRGVLAGAAGVLAKPFRTEHLTDLVFRLLYDSSVQR